MAEPEEAAVTGAHKTFGFLTRKLGPLPVWAYALVAVGVYYWYTHYGPGATASQAAAASQPVDVVVVKDDDGSGGTPPVTGAKTTTVPNVTGKDVEQAKAELASAGLRASGPAGAKGVVHTVTGTAPAAGAKVKTGSTVTLHYKTVKEGSKKPFKEIPNPIVTPGNPEPSKTPAPAPAPVPPAGRWQNPDTEDLQPAATAPTAPSDAAASVMDIIPPRPLGM